MRHVFLLVLIFLVVLMGSVAYAANIYGLSIQGVVQKIAPETGNDSLTVRDDSLWIVIDDTTRISFIAGDHGGARLQGGINETIEFAYDSIFVDADTNTATPIILFGGYGGALRWNRATDKMQFSNNLADWSDIGTSAGLASADFNDSLDVASYLDSTNITDQGISPNDIDSTDNDFVFHNIFCGTSATVDSVYVTIETIEDSLAGYFTQGAAQAEIEDSLNEYVLTTSLEDSLDAYLITAAVQAEIEDSLDEYLLTTEVQSTIHDSLDANWATFIASGEGMAAADFKDSLDAAAYLDSTNIADQGITPNDIDSTDNDFVFHDAFKGTSASTDSVFVTIETIEDSLAGYFTQGAAQAEIGDSLDEYPLTTDLEDSLDGYWTTAAVQAEIEDSLNEYVLTTSLEDSLDAYVISSEVAYNDGDTLTGTYVFSSAFRGASATAESTYVTLETIEDSLALCGRVAGQVWTGTHDFGGGVFEITNGDNPTTDADGEMAWDADDEAIEIYSGDESESALIPFYQKIDACIFAPDAVADVITLLKVDALLYPHGIEIDQLSFTLPADAAYDIGFHEWTGADPPVFSAQIDSLVTTASDAYIEDGTPTDGAIAADATIRANIRSTDVDWVHIQIIFHVTEGD